MQGRRCVLKDCCVIEDNTVLPPETVVPSFTKYGGSPGVCTGEVPECMQELMLEYTRNYYQHFLPAKWTTTNFSTFFHYYIKQLVDLIQWFILAPFLSQFLSHDMLSKPYSFCKYWNQNYRFYYDSCYFCNCVLLFELTVFERVQKFSCSKII